MSELPLVSCIMPTHDRRRFVRQAIRYFERQDYPRRELVIVDDGSDRVADAVPADPRIRYLRLHRQFSIGAKRNLACAAARGEIIVFWDDDDWYAPTRLGYQVRPLLDRRVDVTGLYNSLILRLDRGEFWSCTNRLHDRMFAGGVVGGTLAFRRQLWRRQMRFPDVSLAEDAQFLKAARLCGARLQRLSNDGVFVYVRHRANTWRFAPGEFLERQAWHRLATPPAFFPARDLEFYGFRG